MAYFLDNYPVSDTCANLALTEEEENYCRVVYKLDDQGGARFNGLWDPEKKYSDEFVIVPLRSTDAQSVDVNSGTKFANVEWSSRDPYPGKYKEDDPGKNNWLHLWIKLTGGGFVRNCFTDGSFYYLDGGGREQTRTQIYIPNDLHPKAAQCSSGDMRGGHVILNATASATVPPGGPVYIIPICNTHNVASCTSGGHWGAGFYMKLRNDTKALQLTGYLNNVMEYIVRFKDKIRHE